jgi:putative membrane protein
MQVIRRLGVLMLEWFSLALGVFIAAHLGFLTYKDFSTLVVVAMVLGIFNSFLRPFLLAIFLIVSIPVLILTLGLGTYLILFLTNGAILGLTANLMGPSFELIHWAYATLTICYLFLVLLFSRGY